MLADWVNVNHAQQRIEYVSISSVPPAPIRVGRILPRVAVLSPSNSANCRSRIRARVASSKTKRSAWGKKLCAKQRERRRKTALELNFA